HNGTHPGGGIQIAAPSHHRHAQIPRPADATGVRWFEAGEQLQQRRLATAVEAHHTGALPGVDAERDAVEQHTLAERLVDGLQVDQIAHASTSRSITVVTHAPRAASVWTVRC